MRIATLGPAGSNHVLVLDRYIATRELSSATPRLFASFDEAFPALLAGDVDYLLQCSAHPSHGEWVSRTMHRAFPVDAFIAPSKPLAILARTEIASPRRLGLQPATRHYADLSAYPELIEEPTTVSVAEGLLSGRLEAGICAREALDQHPECLRLVQDLGPALDTWVLFGREKLPGDLVLCAPAPR
ncbi:hypothetical protein [Halomonas urumqiensis]|uniref:LysR substrate-binding domain-containing protein n=1 Tax=Halomonas urumqiensis TaxID=1684789 RepID=A0A2N7UEY6_9GAMM|nr:hypothetical protein [Halomonas urumqiensis]PMR78997.1 hypothetical protein C1H70_13740 [Halomonas urumqiensis]PTB00991.1 hypothetical protein C6V82_17410 [Halomonas urumqiensis]GHE22935.1 hypothetical protein GCM10017767_34560 [Halomonas urumqiensis]